MCGVYCLCYLRVVIIVIDIAYVAVFCGVCCCGVCSCLVLLVLYVVKVACFLLCGVPCRFYLIFVVIVVAVAFGVVVVAVAVYDCCLLLFGLCLC